MSILHKALDNGQCFCQKKQTDTGLVLEVGYLFSKDSPVFAGHFPGHPVLPAVVILLMASRVLEREGFATKLCDAKFLAPIGCDESITLVCCEKNDRFVCTVSIQDTCAAKILLQRVDNA